MLQFLDVSEQKQQQVEAETVPIADTDVDVATVDKDTDEFREKNNDELMEKELVTKKLSTDVERNWGRSESWTFDRNLNDL